VTPGVGGIWHMAGHRPLPFLRSWVWYGWGAVCRWWRLHPAGWLGLGLWTRNGDLLKLQMVSCRWCIFTIALFHLLFWNYGHLGISINYGWRHSAKIYLEFGPSFQKGLLLFSVYLSLIINLS